MSSKKGYLPIGSKITVKFPIPPYGYRYMTQEELKSSTFIPGFVGIIAAITPKVCLVRGEGLDGKPYFYCVDYVAGGKKYRTGINHCNAIVVKDH